MRYPDTIQIPVPDDWHVHLRQEEMLRNLTVPYAAQQFGRALVMPNTTPPILTATDVRRYRDDILAAMQRGQQDTIIRPDRTFTPLMTIQLTKNTITGMIRDTKRAGVVAAKLYPEGVTTNSANGLRMRDLNEMGPVFQVMSDVGMVLSIHGEMPGEFCLDRERLFLERFESLLRSFPRLKVVLEHISTSESVTFVNNHPTVGATITLHHLLLTLDDVVGGLLQPHLFCKPIAKQPWDREALIRAATSGSGQFFFGSDSAPHRRDQKECAGGCAGIFTAPVLIPVLVELFEKWGKDIVQHLQPFLCWNGAKFYGVEAARTQKLTLNRKPWVVPESIGGVVPFLAGQTLQWQVAS